MPSPTRCVIHLCFRATQHADNMEIVDEIAQEYWQSMKHSWDFYEYLDATMRIITAVDAPPDQDIEQARWGY